MYSNILCVFIGYYSRLDVECKCYHELVCLAQIAHHLTSIVAYAHTKKCRPQTVKAYILLHSFGHPGKRASELFSHMSTQCSG